MWLIIYRGVGDRRRRCIRPANGAWPARPSTASWSAGPARSSSRPARCALGRGGWTAWRSPQTTSWWNNNGCFVCLLSLPGRTDMFVINSSKQGEANKPVFKNCLFKEHRKRKTKIKVKKNGWERDKRDLQCGTGINRVSEQFRAHLLLVAQPTWLAQRF